VRQDQLASMQSKSTDESSQALGCGSDQRPGLSLWGEVLRRQSAACTGEN